MKVKAVVCAAVLGSLVAAGCSEAEKKPVEAVPAEPSTRGAASGEGSRIAWGEAVEGLQLSLRAHRTSCRPDESVRLKFALRVGPRVDGWQATDHPDSLTLAIDGPGGRREEELYRWNPETLPLRDWTPLRSEAGGASPGREHVLDFAGEGEATTVAFTLAGTYRLQATYAFDGRSVNARRKWHPVAWEGGSVRSNVVTVTVTPSGAATPAGAASMPVAWGEAVNGLQAGLEIRKRKLGSSEPIEWVIHVKSTGKNPVTLCDGAFSHTWTVAFSSAGTDAEWRPEWRYSMERSSVDLTVAAGQTKRLGPISTRNGLFPFEFCDVRERAPARKTLDFGVYSVTASYVYNAPEMKRYWHGTVQTGPVEIEITAKDETAAPAE
jgi:hypothetical protein